jgi:hypothetical protein
LEGKATEGTDRRLEHSLPFFFGGFACFFIAFMLRGEVVRKGNPPMWVLFIAIGCIAVGAGIVLLWAQDDEPEGKVEARGDEVVVKKEEWHSIQEELSQLRTLRSKLGDSAADTKAGDEKPTEEGPAPLVAKDETSQAKDPTPSETADAPAPKRRGKGRRGRSRRKNLPDEGEGN